MTRLTTLALVLAMGGCEPGAAFDPAPDPAPPRHALIQRHHPGAERTLDRMQGTLDALHGTLDEGAGAP
jgi:hypothetical protein